jgi:hypothetical protein
MAIANQGHILPTDCSSPEASEARNQFRRAKGGGDCVVIELSS